MMAPVFFVDDAISVGELEEVISMTRLVIQRASRGSLTIGIEPFKQRDEFASACCSASPGGAACTRRGITMMTAGAADGDDAAADLLVHPVVPPPGQRGPMTRDRPSRPWLGRP